MVKRLTTESMINKFRSAHGDVYDYSHVDSDNRDANGKVRIVCPIHGEFSQTPTNHIRGKGCPLCFGKIRKDTLDVINEIKSIYGDKYVIPNDFVYISNKTLFNIVCNKHGEWSTTYSRLVTKRCSRSMYDTKSFTERIIGLYKEPFDYKYVDFKGFRSKIELKCKNCGKLLSISPSVLLNGTAKCDCSSSKLSKIEAIVKEALESNGIDFTTQYKADWLRLKEPLSLDFYIPSANIGIECQGRMHFEPFIKNDIKSAECLSRQIERDKEKYKLCKEHGIKLLYYSNVEHDGEYIDEIHGSIDEIITIIKLNNK